MFLIFVISCLLFAYFFWKINFIYGMYLVFFVLSLILVFSFYSDEGKKNWKQIIKKFFFEYIMYINFIIIGLGVFFILKYFISLYYHGLIVDIKALIYILTGITFISLIGVVFNKKEITQVSFFGIFVIWFILLSFIKDIKIFYYAVSYINSLSIVGYLLYLTFYFKINRFFSYNIFITFTIVLFIIIKLYFIDSIIVFSFIIQVFIFLLLVGIIKIDKIYKKILEIEKKLKEKDNELKLFGFSNIKMDEKDEKFYKNHLKNRNIYEFVYNFFIHAPEQIKILFSLTNTIPIIIASYYFFHNLNLVSKIENELFYWFGAIMYFINFLLFKKLNWFVVIQRIFAFFVINFVTYFTIVDFSGHNYLFITMGGILWNLFTTVLILFIDKKKNLFNSMDYLIWSIVNFLGVFINIYFLFKIGLNYYLSIGVALLYLGFYLFLYRIVYKKAFL